MSAILFDNKIIGFGDPDQVVQAYLDCGVSGDSANAATTARKYPLVKLDQPPTTWSTFAIGTIAVVGKSYYRVVEKEVTGWIGGPQLKHRAELISDLKCYPMVDPEAANIGELKTKHSAEVDRLNSIITCLNNSLNDANKEADKLREELARDSEYSAIMNAKCERMLKELARSTSAKFAIETFNGNF